MLTIERVKELFSDPSLSDKEAEQIRDELRTLAEIVVGHLLAQQRQPTDRPNPDGDHRSIN